MNFMLLCAFAVEDFNYFGSDTYDTTCPTNSNSNPNPNPNRLELSQVSHHASCPDNLLHCTALHCTDDVDIQMSQLVFK